MEGLAPLDAALGLPDEKYTHDVRRIVAEESAKSSFDEVVELIAKRTGARVPKRQVEELTVRAAQDFDAYYRDRLCEPEQTDDLLVLSFDGKGIAMRHEDLREATRKAAATEPKLHTRLAKGEKPNRKRMAQVAAVYSIAPWQRTSSDVLHGLREPRAATRPRPTNKRVWASAARSAQAVIEDAFDEALRRDPDLRRRWVVLVDGQRDQIKRVERAARKVGVEITIVLDIVHALEYLWRAAYTFHADGTPAAEAWVEHQLVKLLSGRSGGEIAKSMRLMAKSHNLDAAAVRPVEKAASYLVKHTRLLHYDRALADGLPIATGGSSRARAATSCRTEWAVPAHAGRSRVPRRFCAFARCERAATSTTTGSFISRRRTSAPTSHATPTAQFPTRCHRSGRCSDWSSDRNCSRRPRRERAAPNSIPTTVLVDHGGNLVVAGTLSGSANFGAGAITSSMSDTFVAKYTSTGAYIIAKVLGGTGSDTSGSVSVDPADNIFVVGRYVGNVSFGGASPLNTNNGNMVIAKYSAAGAYQWAQAYGGTTAGIAAGRASVNSAGDIVVSGSFCGSATFGTSFIASVGTCASNDFDLFAARFSGADGIALRATRAGGSMQDLGYAVVQASDGRHFVVGGFQGFADFAGTNRTSAGGYDGIVVGLAPL